MRYRIYIDSVRVNEIRILKTATTNARGTKSTQSIFVGRICTITAPLYKYK